MSTQFNVGKDPRDILVAPVLTEKSYSLLDEGKYTFVVDPRANKTEIKIAVEQIFDVKVDSVHKVDAENGLLLIKGAIPGRKGGLVIVKSAVKGGARA